MILTAAMEFHPANSKMVKDRPSDDAELIEVCVCVCVRTYVQMTGTKLLILIQ